MLLLRENPSEFLDETYPAKTSTVLTDPPV